MSDMQDTMILAKYLRISDDDGRYGESQSIEGQRMLLDDFIASNPELSGAHVLEYVDDGWSGTNFNRPSVQELLIKAKNGGVHCIIVKDFSRFGRNYIDVGDYLEQIFPFLRVRFISVNDGFDSARQECSAGDVGVAFKSLCNDYYSKELSRKVRSGIVTLRESGKYHASTAPFGYTKADNDMHRIVVDPDAACTVRRIFNMALDGMRAKEIAHTLNSEKILTPGKYKLERTGRKVGYNTNNVWTDNAVRVILKDVRYTGLLVQGMTRSYRIADDRHYLVPKEQWHISPTRHEAIVSTEDYEKVQNLISSKRQPEKREREIHPLSGKVRCGGCGHALYRSSTKHPTYLCGYKAYYENLGCPRKGVKVALVEEVTLAVLKSLFSAFEVKEKSWREIENQRAVAGMERIKEIQSLQRQINGIRNEKLALYTQFSDGDIEKDDYVRLRDETETRLQELTAQVAALELLAVKKREVDVSDPFIDKLRDLRFEDSLTREIVAALIDRIVVYDKDRIEIKWKYSDAALAAVLEKGSVN